MILLAVNHSLVVDLTEVLGIVCSVLSAGLVLPSALPFIAGAAKLAISGISVRSSHKGSAAQVGINATMGAAVFGVPLATSALILLASSVFLCCSRCFTFILFNDGCRSIFVPLERALVASCLPARCCIPASFGRQAVRVDTRFRQLGFPAVAGAGYVLF